MSLENVRLGHSKLTDRVFAGYLGKDEMTWVKKKDITSDFIGAVIERFSGYKETISVSDGRVFEITVKEIKKAGETQENSHDQANKP